MSLATLVAPLAAHAQAPLRVLAFPDTACVRFEVRAPGRALADDSASQRIRVQNLNSLKIVEGTAENDGVVRVTP